jgi:DNA adenine methylase
MQSNFLLKDSTYYQLYLLESKAEPFLKWAGGKRQILDQIHDFLPKQLSGSQQYTYIEPFVGGGAVFFSLSFSPNMKRSILIDINPVLTISYKVIKNHVLDLINKLKIFENIYNNFKSEEKRSEYYYNTRTNFNELKKKISLDTFENAWIELASKFIFLNRTCFNGLYRVNSKGEFNVPQGSYKNPRICDSENLIHVSRTLQNATIINADFEISEQFIDSSSFIYLDPPYRPINETSSFTSYSKENFDDADQKRLARFCYRLENQGVKFLLSNSDPKNTDPSDNFFDNLYKDFRIVRIPARRNINSNANDRGTITELLIMNY